MAGGISARGLLAALAVARSYRYTLQLQEHQGLRSAAVGGNQAMSWMTRRSSLDSTRHSLYPSVDVHHLMITCQTCGCARQILSSVYSSWTFDYRHRGRSLICKYAASAQQPLLCGRAHTRASARGSAKDDDNRYLDLNACS